MELELELQEVKEEIKKYETRLEHEMKMGTTDLIVCFSNLLTELIKKENQ